MKPDLYLAYENEITSMKKAYWSEDYTQSFYHLERAHILGQRHFISHLQTHWWMLKIGCIRRDMREIMGQILRILAVFPAHMIGWVPIGNTGGANVSALKPMTIPDDLSVYFEGKS
ncbi:MAG: DUF3703 domain-containing protein [Maricaulaceae bacterium]